MKPILKKVLFIDDDEATNFVHELVFLEIFPDIEIVIKNNGQEALDYLKETDNEAGPDLILLDINMPVMDGWEFLEAYNNLTVQVKDNIVAFMISSSLNPDDFTKANENENISSFLTKPMTEEALQALCENHFLVQKTV